MTNLLILFSLIFLLAALLGIELGYWLARRKFVDVTDAYKDLRRANARSDISHWKRLWKRLDAMPAPKEPDLTGVNERMERLEHQLVALMRSVNAIPQTKAPDLARVHSQLNKIAIELHELRAVNEMQSEEEVREDSLDSTDEMPALVL